MKRSLLIFLCLLISCNIFAQKLNTLLNYKAYCTDDSQPYIEFQFIIDGQSVAYVPTEDGNFQAEVEITASVEQNDSAIANLHFIIVSDIFSDSVKSSKPDFSTVQNVKVANGDYTLRFNLKDLHADSKPVRYIDMIQVYFPEDKVSSSSITLLRELSGENGRGICQKYGYTMTPLYFDYAPEKMVVLPMMMEIYNTEKILGKDNYFFVKTYIELFENGLLANAQEIRYIKKKTAPLSVFMHQFNILKLYSGNYNVVVEILDADSNVLASTKAFFQRSNPEVELSLADYDNVEIAQTFVDKITDSVLLRDYVACLYPISSTVEKNFFDKRLKKIPTDRLKRYFYSFWLRRNSQNPEMEWLKYKAQVDYVNKTYGSKVVKGYRTDRGRVYLQYGPPTQIIEEVFDPQSYPYEIWTYYVLGSQTNVKFVFYAYDVVTNEYELLHSDAIGEVRNTKWQMELTRRLNPTLNPDITTPDEYWGGDIQNNWKLNR